MTFYENILNRKILKSKYPFLDYRESFDRLILIKIVSSVFMIEYLDVERERTIDILVY
jgi:hypothetical protein